MSGRCGRALIGFGLPFTNRSDNGMPFVAAATAPSFAKRGTGGPFALAVRLIGVRVVRADCAKQAAADQLPVADAPDPETEIWRAAGRPTQHAGGPARKLPGELRPPPTARGAGQRPPVMLYRCPPGSCAGTPARSGPSGLRSNGKIKGKGGPVRHGKTLAVGRPGCGRSIDHCDMESRKRACHNSTASNTITRKGTNPEGRACACACACACPYRSCETALQKSAGGQGGRGAVWRFQPSASAIASASRANPRVWFVIGLIHLHLPPQRRHREPRKRRGDPEEKPLDCFVGFASSQ